MANSHASIPGRVIHAQLIDYRNPRASHQEIFEPPPGDPRSERGSLYVLVELIGVSPVGNHAVREIQSVVEQTYYSAVGRVSEVLEQAVVRAHQALQDLNRGSPDIDLEAGILCAAVVQGHLVIAAAGPAMALVSTAQRLDQFPLDADRYNGAIGGDLQPSVQLYKHLLRSGDALFLGESEWFLQSDIRTIGGAVVSTTANNMHEMIVHLRQQGESMPLLGMLLVYTDQSFPAPIEESEGSARLPTALGAAPPMQGATPRPGARPLSASGRPHSGKLQLPSAPKMQYQLTVPFRSFSKLRGPWYRRTLSFLDRQRKWVAGLVVGLLPDRVASPAATPEKAAAEEETPYQAPPAQQASAPPPGPQEQAQLPALPGYAPPAPTTGKRRKLIIALALVIPLLTSAVVGAALLREGSVNQEEGLQLIELADTQLLRVQKALSIDDKATARSALSEAQRFLDEAIVLIGVNDQIQGMSEIIATELQDLLQVRALYSLDFPLIEYGSDAEPHRVVVSDQDIYVLDSGRQVIEHYRTNSERNLLEVNNGVVLKEGDVVSGVTVGRIVDIAWQPRISGFAEKASLLVLDRNNNVFRYNRLDGVTHLVLREQGSLESVGQLAVYNGRLYLADEKSNQIFRYSPAGLDYDDPPAAWFDDQVQGDLSALVSMEIDGDIWLLSEDGTLLRYRQGEQLPFTLERIPGLGGLLVDLAMEEAPDGMLYVADATEERILVFDKNGRYVEQYVDAEDIALAGLRGIFLEEVTEMLYVLTGTGLYAHPLPR